MIAQMLKTNFDVTCFTYEELSCFLDYICRFLARLRRLFNECVTIECGRIYIAKQLEGMVRGEDASSCQTWGSWIDGANSNSATCKDVYGEI